MNEFKKSASLPEGRGIILSDFDGTLSLPKFEKGRTFHDDLFACLLGWKKAGYTVILHTTSPSPAVDGTISMKSMMAKVASDFFEYDGGLVANKSDTYSMDVLAVFDDEPISRGGKTGMLIDPNQPHVVAALKRLADDYRAGKEIHFNPQDYKAPSAPGSEPNLNGGVA